MHPRPGRARDGLRKTITTLLTFVCAGALLGAGPTLSGTGPAQSGQGDSSHTHGVNSRGDQAMHFSHMKSTHHFRLLPDGGAIEVMSNDAADTVSRNAIRAHLGHIVQMFSAGDFRAPMFIHDRVPPGVAEMERLKDQIRYAYQPIENGGRVRISTRNARALVAIHEFLRFQITDHKTGDPLDVMEQPR